MSSALSRLEAARADVKKSFDFRASSFGGINSSGSDDGLPFTPGNQALGVMGGNPMHTQAIEQYRHNQGWVYASIRTIAQRIARQPLRIVRKKRRSAGSRRDPMLESSKRLMPGFVKELSDDVEMVTDHPFLDAINNPNPIMVRWSLLFCMVASLELTGRHFWWIYKTKGGTFQIWPLPTHWVEPVFGGDKVYGGWKIRPFGTAGEIAVPANEIAMFSYPDPSNPLGAVAPLQANAKGVVTDEFVQEAQKRAFMNSIWPGLAVVVGRLRDTDKMLGQNGNQRVVLTDAQRENVVSMIRSRFRGIYKSDEPAVLDGFIEDIKKITNTPRDMDFQKAGEITKDRVTQGLGVNPISMGAVEAASRASSAVADDHLLSNNVNPKIELISQCMTAFVLPSFGNDSYAAYLEEARSVDADLDQRKYAEGMKLGTCTINEYRMNILNLPPIKGGDVVLVTSGMVPLHLADKQGPAPKLGDVPLVDYPLGDSLAPAADDPANDPSGDETVPAPEETADPPAEEEASISGLRWTVLAKHMTRSELLEGWEKRLSASERIFGRAVKRFLRSKSSEMVRRAQSAIHGVPTNADSLSREIVGDEREFVADFRRAMKKPLEKLIASGALAEWRLYRPRSGRMAAAMLYKKAGEDRLPLPSRVRDAVERYAKEVLDQPYWEDLPSGIRESIAREITRGIDAGSSGADVTSRIDTLLGGDSERRASLITRTETTGALNAGAEASRQELAVQGVIAGKEWLCMFDKDTRPEHADANAQKVAVDGKFDIGGELCDYPGDFVLSAGMRCNCRCTSLAVIDVDALTQEAGERLALFVSKCLAFEGVAA